MGTLLPKNSVASEILRNKSVILDIEEQKRVLTQRQLEHQVIVNSLEGTGLAEWEEVVIDTPPEETPSE